MINYKEIFLGEESLIYVKNVLTEGKTLSHLVLEEINLRCGNARTYLPEYVTESSANQFSEGGKIKLHEKEIIRISNDKVVNTEETDENKDVIKMAKRIGRLENSSDLRITPIPNTDFWLIPSIKDFIIKEGCICIFENELAEPSDPWLFKRKSQIVSYNNEVYHFIDSHNLSETNIENTIRESKGAYPPLIGIVSKLNTDIMHDGGSISLDTLKSLVKKAEKLIVGAYDGEGYLLWEKQ